MASSYNAVIRFGNETKTVDFEEAVAAVKTSNPIASILQLIGMTNVSVKKVPREVAEEDFFMPVSAGKGSARLSDEEKKAVATKFLAAIDAGESQADAARIAYPPSDGTTQTVKKWAQQFHPNHKLFRKAEAPKSASKSK